ncbi:MAG: Calx-beta domain-containing protein, partial [Nocardioides sp.]
IVDRNPRPRVIVDDATIDEPQVTNQLGFTEVHLSAPSGRRVVVHLASRPGTATTADFVPLHPTAVFAPGETSQFVSVEVLPDGQVEGPETVRLVVTSARHARPPSRPAIITIDDADP